VTWRVPAFTGIMIVFAVMQFATPQPLNTWVIRVAVVVITGWIAAEFWWSMSFNGRLMRSLTFMATAIFGVFLWVAVAQTPSVFGYHAPWAVWMNDYIGIPRVLYAVAGLNLIVELRLGRRR
jgi:hypothetical protein